MSGNEFGALVVAGVVYFLPALVAYNRRTLNRTQVLVIDIFLGWTFIGWVVALAMAVTRNVEPRPPDGGEKSPFPWVNWMNRR